MQEAWRLAAIEAIKRAVVHGDVDLARGGRSNVYVDKWKILADPRGWQQITHALCMLMGRIPQIDCLAAPEMGAVPFAAQLAGEISKPLVVIRRHAKLYGLDSGRLTMPVEWGTRALVIEDVVTTGDTALDATNALLAAGAKVDTVLCLVDRGRGKATLADAGITLQAICTLEELLG